MACSSGQLGALAKQSNDTESRLISCSCEVSSDDVRISANALEFRAAAEAELISASTILEYIATGRFPGARLLAEVRR